MSPGKTKLIMVVSALIPVIAAIILCMALFDMRQVGEAARQMALEALGAPTEQASGTPLAAKAPAEAQKVDNAYSELVRALEPQLRSQDVAIERREGALEIRFLGNVLFHSGSADITSEGAAVLETTGHALAKIEKEGFAILGHTDNVPIQSGVYPSNWELSTARACAVVRFLSSKAGIDPVRFYAIGRGEYAPTSSNSTEEGRAKNRRVEILVTDMSNLRRPEVPND